MNYLLKTAINSLLFILVLLSAFTYLIIGELINKDLGVILQLIVSSAVSIFLIFSSNNIKRKYEYLISNSIKWFAALSILAFIFFSIFNLIILARVLHISILRIYCLLSIFLCLFILCQN